MPAGRLVTVPLLAGVTATVSVAVVMGALLTVSAALPLGVASTELLTSTLYSAPLSAATVVGPVV